MLLPPSSAETCGLSPHERGSKFTLFLALEVRHVRKSHVRKLFLPPQYRAAWLQVLPAQRIFARIPAHTLLCLFIPLAR